MSDVNITKRELNLLILGQTGAGKSTFINALVNAMTFDSLTDAELGGKLVSLIASSFAISDSDLNEVVIQTEDADNENFTVGESSTRTSRVYRIVTDSLIIRIIDTPGVGDTRGIHQNEKNLENILATISNLHEIHGILILLKSNNSKLDTMFNFCVTELLMQLDKSAARNIIFGFTNARGTFYRPGDTLPVLRKLLNESELTVEVLLTKENVFCYDSESYRFLAAVKHGVDFDPETRADFEKSWNQFATEVNRLFKHVMSLKPHMVKEMMTINEARQTITGLIKPLGELTQQIEVNIGVVNQKIEELRNTKASGNELNNRLNVDMIDLEKKDVDYPRTVCTHTDCTEARDCPGKGTVYHHKACHDPCYLDGNSPDILNNPELLGCWAISGNDCHQCTHGYQLHMHIYYELIPVPKSVTDAGIQDQIAKNATDAQKIQTAIDSHNKRIEEYKSEKKIVEHSAAEFGCFLKHKAMLPTSDARIEYLDYLIRREKAVAQVSGDHSKVQSLMETKQMYQTEFDIIDKAIASKSNLEVLDPYHVAKVESRLMQLKHFGPTLRRVKAGKAKALAIHYKDFPYEVPSGSSFISRLMAEDGNETAATTNTTAAKTTTELPNHEPNGDNMNQESSMTKFINLVEAWKGFGK